MNRLFLLEKRQIPTSIAALIPARAGSTRVKNKNVRLLAGHPLLAWTIATAKGSGIFDEVYVSTDSQETADIAERYGTTVPGLRPAEFATSTSPDIGWVAHTLGGLKADGHDYDAFALLRPTSPFRLPATIKRAWTQFRNGEADSLRAVEKCEQHPYKMWVVIDESLMEPLFPAAPGRHHWHSSQYQALPEIWVQNASLEIAWTKTVFDTASIAGNTVMPFFTCGLEGFDINFEPDFTEAERLVESGAAAVPALLRNELVMAGS